MTQREMFLAFEADAYFERNRERNRVEDLEARAQTDLVLAALERVGVKAERILEIGCSDGWRLARLGACNPSGRVVGIDPSRTALADGHARFEDVGLLRATAERLPLASRSFDVVILGFCLYVVDRDDLFTIAAEVDRVVAANGVVVVHDFIATTPYRKAYRDLRGRYSFKMDYASMFLWNPAYRSLYQRVATHPGGDPSDPDDQVAVSVLQRDTERAYATAYPSGEHPPGGDSGKID